MIKFFIEYTIVDRNIVSTRPLVQEDPTSTNTERQLVVGLYEILESVLSNKKDTDVAGLINQITTNMKNQ